MVVSYAAPVCAPVQEFLKRTQELIKLQVKRGTNFFNKAIDKVKDAIRLEHQIAVATEAGIVNFCEKELVDHAKRAAKEELKHAPKAAVGGASTGAKIEGAAASGENSLQRGKMINDRGKDFEDYLVKKFGGRGSFKAKGANTSREFDGAIGNIWYEAKSGKTWDMLMNNPTRLEKFRSDMARGLKVAQENGAVYELYSETVIPNEIKKWLNKHKIGFKECLKEI